MVKPFERSKQSAGRSATAVSKGLSRRRFLGHCAAGLAGAALLGSTGCRSQQTAQVLKPGDKEFVGTHSAGAETFGPLVDGAVANLLARHHQGVTPAGFTQGAQAGAMKICFVGVENKSVEEMGDFKEQIYQQIDSKILQSQLFTSISRRYVEEGLRQCHLRPDDLLMPQNMRTFSASMEQMGQPFDYLLYATLTSGTTQQNANYQRNYLLTLELVNTHNGQYDKESAELDKRYNVTAGAKITGFLSK